MRIKYILTVVLLSLIVGTSFAVGNDSKFSDICSVLSKSEKHSCWKDEFNNVLKKKGTEKAFNLLSYLYENDSDFRSSCHDYTHLIGEKSYERYSKGQKLKLSESLAYCGYGFYHGFIISLYKDGKGETEASDFCDYVNKELANGLDTALLDCFHGIGHGTTDFDISKVNLIEDLDLIIGNSIQNCKKVSTDEKKVSRCVDGVYHSVLDGSISNEKITNLFKKDGIFTFCNSQKEEFITSCYQSAGFLVMYLNNNEFEKTLLLSQNEVKEKYASVLIRQMAGFEGYRNVGKMEIASSLQSCKKLTLNLKNECIKGLVEGVTDFGIPGNEEKEIESLCNNKILNNLEKDFCLGHSVEYFRVYFGEEKKSKLCDLIGDVYCKTQ